MGIIGRQTIKSSIYSLAGVIVGFVTVGILMPHYLSKTEIGVIRQIQYYGMLFSSILGLGIPQSLIRLFPHFKSKKEAHHGMFFLVTLITIFSGIIFTIIFLNFGEDIVKKDILKSPLFASFYKLILPFTWAYIFLTLFESYSTANKESTISVFLRDFALRIFIIGIITFYIFIPSFDYAALVYSNVYVQFIPPLLLLVFLHYKGLIPVPNKISFPSSKIKSEFISTSAYNWVNGLSSVAVVTIDSIMLSKMTNSADVGIYTTVTFFASLMLIPNKNIGRIAATVIADHFKNNQLEKIETIYKKSALTQYALGLFLLGNLVLGIPFIFQILLKGEYNAGIWVLIFLAISNLFKMGTGLKFSVVFTSKHYRWSTPMFLSFLILIVLTNLWFIPRYGIVGSAIASFIATTLFHIAGLILVKVKYNYWPFTKTFISVGFVFLLIFGILYLIPNFDFPIIFSIIKAGLFSVLFFLYLYQSKSVAEINGLTDSIIQSIKKLGK
jgi:O-antigen/teichoic acid export membrane protein